MAKFELHWEAPEYEYHEKGVSWYWGSIIVAALIIAFSVWEKNFLFGLFVVIAEILLITWGNRMPRTVNFTLTDDAITIEGEKSRALAEFETVSIGVFENGWAELIFSPRARFHTTFKTLFPEERLTELRNALKPVLKEAPYEPTFLDTIEKLLRF